MSELRHLIREILTEELGKMPAPSDGASGAPGITEEQVTIRSNADLATFVQRLMTAAQDGRLRADIGAGRHVFRLATGGVQPLQAHQPGAPNPTLPPTVHFERGLVSEREVAALPQGAGRIEVGKSVRFTPLARDELRRRGINVERSQS